jgi:hypothetical protein
MKIIAIAALGALVVTALPAHAATPQQKETAAWQAYKDKQGRAFMGMLTPDYVGVYQTGNVTRDQEIEGMKKSKIESFAISGFTHRMIDPDDVLMTYTVEIKGSDGKDDISGTYHAASIWHRSGQGKQALWRAVYHTNVKAK